MAQSNNQSNVRGIQSFWRNHTLDPPFPWEGWSDLFHLAIIAKENINIENLLNPQPPNLENPLDDETENQRKSRMDRNVQEQRRYDEEESASIKSETKKFNGM